MGMTVVVKWVLARLPEVVRAAVFGCVSVAGLVACQGQTTNTSIEVVLDGAAEGRTFEGVGAISAGACSRLLIDYPEPQRTELLDYLFRPNYGAALQHLKVEIGGEILSTSGTEPTHMRTREEEDYTRGWEWWLMKEAKARNPGMIFECLAWGAPRWVGNGVFYSQDMADYVVKYIQGARRIHGIEFRYTGVWNEKVPNLAWIKLLRRTLDQAGLQSVRIVAADQFMDWSIADAVLADPALSVAVDVLGCHYPSFPTSAAALQTGKPLWASESGPRWGDWIGAQQLARMLNHNYVQGHLTKSVLWSLISATYDTCLFSEDGLIFARQPWSGFYEVQPNIWAAAHTTQFAFPGWKYLEGRASALLSAGGSLVTLKAPGTGDYSVVVETASATRPQSLHFRLTNGLSGAPLSVWRSTLTRTFAQVATVTPQAGEYAWVFEPNGIYTLSTLSGQRKGQAEPVEAGSLALPYFDDFEAYATNSTARYLIDQSGLFEVVPRPDGTGKALRQTQQIHGIQWIPEHQPYSIIGDRSWRDYEVSADVYLETDGFVALFGRLGKMASVVVPTPKGYSLRLGSKPGWWELWTSEGLLKSGSLTFATNVWHHVALAMCGGTVRCLVDGAEVGVVEDPTYSGGLAGLGSGLHGALFDNFCIRRLHRGIRPVNLARSAVASASSIFDVRYTADKANDGDSGTRWNPWAGAGADEWIQLEWGQPRTIGRTQISQFDDRILAYRIQAWNGLAWQDLATSGRMGDLGVDCFEPVATTRLRLYVDRVVYAPTIWEFEAYASQLPSAPLPQVRINEWMLHNTRTLVNPRSGRYDSWFELANLGTTETDLTGYLLEGGDATNRVVIPPGIRLPPGACLLVWSDGTAETSPDVAGGLHIGFRIEGLRSLALYTPDERLVDAVDLEPQPADISHGSATEDDPAIVPLTQPTPQSPNLVVCASASQRCADGTLRIEFRGQPLARHCLEQADDLAQPSWTELGSVAADALGRFHWVLSPSTQEDHRFFRSVRR
jgi:hypothetical protein